MPTDALGLMPFKANWNMGVVEDSTCRLGPFDAMGRLAGLTYTVYIIHLVRIWLLGIWDQANWVPFSSFCLNHLISRKSLILSFHGYFFHVILMCDFSTYLCASWTHCSGISFIIHYFFCQLCLIKMPLERLVWGWALPVLGGALISVSLEQLVLGGALPIGDDVLDPGEETLHSCVHTWDGVTVCETVCHHISFFLSNSRWCNNTWVLSCAAAAIADDSQKDILAWDEFWGSLSRKKREKVLRSVSPKTASKQVATSNTCFNIFWYYGKHGKSILPFSVIVSGPKWFGKVWENT